MDAALTRVLVVNAGSETLKLSVVEGEDATRVESLAVDGVDAVGHRVVHGGARFRAPVQIDEEVERALRELVAVAPLHNAPALRGIAEARAAHPDVPHVAAFDTAFHETIPSEAATYALPKRWRDEWGIRRFGFHGLSVEWSAERVRASRLVVCHLGGGCSVTAVRDGRSVDTTMGFTPLEGLVMASRAGSVDPGALLHVQRAHGVAPEELDRVLNDESGLVALAGTAEVRDLERREDEEATLALAVYAHRAAAAVAAMTASLGGLDALVFTAGVGEHSARVRADVCARLAHLGVRLDPGLNAAARGDADVAAAGSSVRVAVVAAREDVVIARHVRRALGG